MPTQLDNTWLPPEARTGGDGSIEQGPFDYGSGEYNQARTSGKIFNGKIMEAIAGYHKGYTYSSNIRLVIERYEIWRKQNKKELQKITDGKQTLTIDDLLWYLRYEEKTTIADILGENRTHSNGPVIHLPSKLDTMIDEGHIPHTLMHRIKMTIDELVK